MHSTQSMRKLQGTLYCCPHLLCFCRATIAWVLASTHCLCCTTCARVRGAQPPISRGMYHRLLFCTGSGQLAGKSTFSTGCVCTKKSSHQAAAHTLEAAAASWIRSPLASSPLAFLSTKCSHSSTCCFARPAAPAGLLAHGTASTTVSFNHVPHHSLQGMGGCATRAAGKQSAVFIGQVMVK
jgi:hypothetical protein